MLWCRGAAVWLWRGLQSTGRARIASHRSHTAARTARTARTPCAAHADWCGVLCSEWARCRSCATTLKRRLRSSRSSRRSPEPCTPTRPATAPTLYTRSSPTLRSSSSGVYCRRARHACVRLALPQHAACHLLCSPQCDSACTLAVLAGCKVASDAAAVSPRQSVQCLLWRSSVLVCRPVHSCIPALLHGACITCACPAT
jgi:hypothetical protein